MSEEKMEADRFMELCAALPPDTHWGDAITPDIVAHIRQAALQESEAGAVAGWHPIETAPKDNKRPLLLAKFVDGKLRDVDFNGRWEDVDDGGEDHSIVTSQDWTTEQGMENPTHWAFQDGFLAPPSAQAIETAAIMKCVELVRGNLGLMNGMPLSIEMLLALIPQDGRTALSQCRKEALLEAVGVCKTLANDAEDCGATPEMLEIVYAIEDELRRMAESDKTTMEGEKE